MLLSEFVNYKNVISEKTDEYKQVVSKLLKKYGVDSPKELDKEKAKKFYKELDTLWVSKEEKLNECFSLWRFQNKQLLENIYTTKKHNIDKTIFEKLIFESFVVQNVLYDIDYPIDLETFKTISKETLEKSYKRLKDDSRSFDEYCYDEYNMQTAPSYMDITPNDYL